MHKILEQLNNLSYQLGQGIIHTQGAGGNISLKVNDKMYIKASGMLLSSALQKNIFTETKLSDVKLAFNQKDITIIKSTENNNLKPSIETIVHGILPKKYVVHTHNLNSLLYLVRKDCNIMLAKKLKNFVYNYSIINYAKPGLELAEEISKTDTNKISVYLLKNHGVIYTADSLEEIYNQIYQLSIILSVNIVKNYNFNLNKDIDFTYLKKNSIKIFPINNVQSLVFGENSINILMKNWALYPDHLVFLGHKPNICDNLEAMLEYTDKDNVLYFVKNQGVFIKGEILNAQIDQLRAYAYIINNTNSIEQLSPLPDNEILKIVNWDSETYRINLAK